MTDYVCKLLNKLPLVKKDDKTIFYHIISQIGMIHIDVDVVNKDNFHVSIKKLRLISRLGGIPYGRTTQGYEIERAKWEEQKSKQAE